MAGHVVDPLQNESFGHINSSVVDQLVDSLIPYKIYSLIRGFSQSAIHSFNHLLNINGVWGEHEQKEKTIKPLNQTAVTGLFPNSKFNQGFPVKTLLISFGDACWKINHKIP